jgi:predicted ABC-type ATPase
MIVVGGPNGAGKTTFVRETQANYGFPYLGADEIAAKIRPESPESVAFEAGRLFITEFDSLIKSETSFVVESTLSGRSFRNSVQAARDAGYLIYTTFVFVDTAEKSISRVAERVRHGGHHVPTVDLRRRFQRCLVNFWDVYRPLSDRWSLVYNQVGRISVAKGEAGVVTVYDEVLFNLFHELKARTSDDF